jgi:hypothetical protein
MQDKKCLNLQTIEKWGRFHKAHLKHRAVTPGNIKKFAATQPFAFKIDLCLAVRRGTNVRNHS